MKALMFLIVVLSSQLSQASVAVYAKDLTGKSTGLQAPYVVCEGKEFYQYEENGFGGSLHYYDVINIRGPYIPTMTLISDQRARIADNYIAFYTGVAQCRNRNPITAYKCPPGKVASFSDIVGADGHVRTRLYCN